MSRILQLTDLHLLSDPAATLNSVPVLDAFREVRDHVLAHEGDFDFVVVTGDIAHDERVETYELFRSELPPEWFGRLRLLPGNHDHRAFMRTVFPEQVLPADVHPTTPIFFEQAFDDVVLYGLDTHVFGQVPGALADTEASTLSQRLADGSDDRPAIVFLHHPPVPVGTAWMDEIGLKNPERLLTVLRNRTRIKAIFCGHVHHHHTGRIGDTTFASTPAVAFQFRPGTESLVFDDLPPGYRVIEADRSGVHSEVRRLPQLSFPASRE